MTPRRAPAVAGLLLLLAACGGGPASAPPPSPAEPGAVLPGAAIELTIDPDGLRHLLSVIDQLLRPGGDPLGPAGDAWLRARQRLEDALVDIETGGPPAPTLLEGFGLSPAAPLGFALRSPRGSGAGWLLVELAAGRRPAIEGPAWHARAAFTVSDAERLRAWLRGLAARFGLEVLPGGRLRDPETGAVAVLRLDGGAGTLDVLMPLGPSLTDAEIEATLAALPPARVAPGPVLRLEVRPAEVGALEVALGVPPALAEGARPAVVEAVAEVAGRCVDRWTQVARVAARVEATLDLEDGRPVAAVRFVPTESGRAAWAAAAGALPLRDLGGLPVALQVALSRRAFLASAPGVATLDEWVETTGCAAGHPLLVALTGLVRLPAFVEPGALPLPLPGPPGAGPHEGVALTVTGATALGGDAVPEVASVLVAPPAALPLPPAPEGATPREDGPGAGWDLHPEGAGLPVSLARLEIGGRAVQVFGMGAGVVDALSARIALVPGPRFLEARLDAGALAASLGAAFAGEPGLEALRALGRRLGVVTLAGTFEDGQVLYELRIRPAAPGGPGRRSRTRLGHAAPGRRVLDPAPPTK